MVWVRFVLALLVSAMSLACSYAQAPKLPEGTTVEKNLAYGEHERQKLDVFVPAGDGPFPLIVWVHGGAWEAGSKERNPAATFLKSGFVVASINYRYSKQAVFPAQIHDCKASIRWLRANAKKYKIDPDHIGVMGASAGGHLVALLGTSGGVKELEGDLKPTDQSSKVQAVCDWFGPTELIKLSPPDAKTGPIARLLGGSTGEKKDLAILANPITHITKDDPPFVILQGDKDPLVAAEQSELLQDALTKAGVPSELIVFKGAGHGDGEFRKQLADDANKNKIPEFFEKHLKPKK